MPKCAFPGCQRNDVNPEDHYSVYKITEFRRKILNWLSLCNLPDSTPKTAVLCEGHFQSGDYEVIDNIGTVTLKKNARPSVLTPNPQRVLQRKSYKCFGPSDNPSSGGISKIGVRSTKVVDTSASVAAESEKQLLEAKSAQPTSEQSQNEFEDNGEKNLGNVESKDNWHETQSLPSLLGSGSSNQTAGHIEALQSSRSYSSAPAVFGGGNFGSINSIASRKRFRGVPVESEVNYLRAEIKRLKEESEAMMKINEEKVKHIQQEAREKALEVSRVKQENLKLRAQVEVLKKNRENSMKSLKKVLNEDQIRILELTNPSGNSKEWSTKTMKEAIAIRLLCKSRGYESLRTNHHWPLPSLSTISRRLRHLDFAPGSFENIISHLHSKLKGEKLDSARLAVMSFDEMSITRRVEYDKGLKRYLGLISPQIARDETEGNEKANHCLAILLRGLTVHWKQLLTYLLTGPSTDTVKLWDYLKMLMAALSRFNIWVVCISTDMGGGNQALWRYLGICFCRFCIKASIPHPFPSEFAVVLYFSPDVAHLIKNLWAQLLRTDFILPSFWVEANKLPGNIVSASHVQEFVEVQGAIGPRPVPGLNAAALNPSKFEKMRVPVAVSFFSEKLGKAIILAAEMGQISPEAKTTGQFILLVAHWYDIHSSRSKLTSLSKGHHGEEKIAFLESFSSVIRQMSFRRVSNNKDDTTWKPTQGGISLSNAVVINMWRTLVQSGPLDYILPSRLFTSSCENLFCQARSGGDLHPPPVRLRHMLRLVSVAQYLRNTTRSSYEDDDEPYYIDFLKVPSQTSHEDWVFDENEIDECLNLSPVEMTSMTRQGLYFIAGWVVFKIKGNCVECDAATVRSSPENFLPHEFTSCISKGGLSHPSSVVWSVLLIAEDIVVNNGKALLLKVDVRKTVTEAVLSKCKHLKQAVPKCHDSISVVANKFLDLRLHILAHDSSINLKPDVLYNSASAFMRTAALNCKDPQLEATYGRIHASSASQVKGGACLSSSTSSKGTPSASTPLQAKNYMTSSKASTNSVEVKHDFNSSLSKKDFPHTPSTRKISLPLAPLQLMMNAPVEMFKPTRTPAKPLQSTAPLHSPASSKGTPAASTLSVKVKNYLSPSTSNNDFPQTPSTKKNCPQLIINAPVKMFQPSTTPAKPLPSTAPEQLSDPMSTPQRKHDLPSPQRKSYLRRLLLS